MDKTGKFAVALAIAIMIGCFMYDIKHPPVPRPASAATPSPTATASSATPQPGTTASATSGTGNATPQATAEPELPEQKQVIKSSAVNFTFTNHGGGIYKAELTGHLLDPDNSSKNVVLNEYEVMPIGATSDQPGEGATVSYTSSQDGQGGISYERTTAQQLQITKKYTLPPAPTTKDNKDQYIVTLDLSVTNHGDKSYKSPGYYIYLGSASPIHPKDQSRYISMDWYLNGKATEINAISAFNEGKIPLLGIQTHPEKIEYTASGDNIGWAGVHSQYFTTIITPDGGNANSVWARRFPLDVATHESGADWVRDNPNVTPNLYAIYGALGMPGYEIAPGKAYTQRFQIYVGPREYKILKQMEQGQAAILQLGYSAPINKFLLSMMNLLVKMTGWSYAVAIIILTIVLKLCLWPLQNTATQSMKKMQLVSPKMNELREKYKDDPTKYNQEMMKLYKTYGVNPLAGCLPMVIQLPVFVGFYTMLGSAIELRNSQFFWVHDLSQPDTVAFLPFLHYPINVLPLCMAATNLWMMKLTPKSGDATQQKMMLFMPLTLLLFCYSYASGLALYLMTSNLFSVAQLYLTRNQAAPTLEKIAAAASKKKR